MAMNPRLMRPLAKTPPGTPASLLLRFNGADESTDFIDSSPNKLTVTAYGDAQISTAQSKFGGASGYFDGASWATTDPILENGEAYTVEAWVFPTSIPTYSTIYGSRIVNDGASFLISAGGTLAAYSDATGLTDSSVTVPLNEWSHLAWSYDGSTFRMFLNGLMVYSGAVALSHEAASYIGRASIFDNDPSGYGEYFNGYIDDFRITKGLAVYTGPFIPPTQQLSAYATPVPVQREAGLLLHFDGDFDDSSVNNLTVTANGDATTSTAQSKFGGSSLYCDGTGDYIDIGQTGSYLHGETGDFTVECWVRPASFTGPPGQAVFGTRPVSPYADDCLVLAIDSSGNPFLHTNNTAMVNSGTAIAVDEWSHLAVVRSGNVFSLYVNGVSVGSYTGAFTLNGTEDALIGAEPRGENLNFDGYIDDLRITKGLAVYDGDFVVPSSQSSSSVVPYTVYKPYGTFLFSECVSGDLVGTYADGVGGRYTEVISVGSC